MKARLLSLHSPDVDFSMASATARDDVVLVELMIGPADEIGEESFDILVCTPQWIERAVMNGPLSGRHLVIVKEVDRDAIVQFVEAYLAELDEPTWGELAEKIGRLGKWEFEDYVPWRPPESTDVRKPHEDS